MLESFGLCSTIALFGKIYLLNFLILLFSNYTKLVIHVIVFTSDGLSDNCSTIVLSVATMATMMTLVWKTHSSDQIIQMTDRLFVYKQVLSSN